MRTQLDIIRAAQNFIAQAAPACPFDHEKWAAWFRAREEELRAEPRAIALPVDRLQQQPPSPKAVALVEEINQKLALPKGCRFEVWYVPHYQTSRLGEFHLSATWTDGIERRTTRHVLSEDELHLANDFGLVRAVVRNIVRELYEVRDR